MFPVSSPTTLNWPQCEKLYIHPEDIAPTWKLTLQKIAEVVIQIIFPIGAILAFSVLLPISFNAVLLPFFAFGVVFSSAFLFTTRKVDLEEISYEQAFPTPAPLEPLSPEAPRGIDNDGANCWVNSLTQLIRCDKGLMKWIKEVPDSLADQLPHAPFMPLDFLFRPNEIAHHRISSVPPLPVLHSEPLPPNFATFTAQERETYREFSDARLLVWVYEISETALIPVRQIFSTRSIEQLLPIQAFERFPVNERAARRNNAVIVIEKIRQFAMNQQMTLSEMEKLNQNITNYLEGIHLAGVFSEGAGTLFIDCVMTDEPIPNEAIGAENLILRGRQLLQICPILRVIFETVRSVLQMTQQQRDASLRYLSAIGSMEASKRLAALEWLETYKNFFTSYDEAKASGSRQVNASSQRLRQLFSQISNRSVAGAPDIDSYSGQECDPAEAFRLLEGLMPPELKVEQEVRRVYNTNGLPPIARCEDGIRRKRELGHGVMTLEVLKNTPNFTAMLANYANKPAEAGENGLLLGTDGNERVYPLVSQQHQFVRGPASLWPSIKRHEFGRPWDFFHWLLPSCFPPPPLRAIKLDTPIHFDEIIQISTIEEGIVSYKLDAFLVHIGQSPNEGHYIAYTLEHTAAGAEVWYEINDAQVRKVNSDELTRASRQAYMPHYSRVIA